MSNKTKTKKTTGYAVPLCVTALGLSVCASLLCAPAPAEAAAGSHAAIESAQAEPGRSVAFSIPAQSLDTALTAFADQAGIRLLVASDSVVGLRAQGLSGTMTLEGALKRLLAGSGLRYRFTDARTVSVERTTSEQGVITLEPVTVEGSRPLDIGRTEGTKSYAATVSTVGSKGPATLREIPQSVSIVTRRRIEDQNFVTVEDAMKQTTGMNIQKFDGAGVFNNITARGYSLDAIQVDGVSTSHYANATTAFDLAMYDRIEVLRGPSGLFQGSGEPSGTVNLVRKRPLDRFRVGGAAQYGSWESFRGEADVSTPLLENNRIRARLVAAYEDRQSYIDFIQAEKPFVYGTVEFDLTPRTTFSVGGARQEIKSVIDQGLPAYADGRLLDVGRSTYIGADWNKLDTEREEGFAELEHRFEDAGYIKLTGRQVRRSMLYKGARASGAVNTTTGIASIQTVQFEPLLNNTSLDAHVSKPFDVAGLTQTVVFGGDYRYETNESASGFGPNYTMNVYAPTPHAIPEPNIAITSRSKAINEQFGTYGQLRVKPTQPVTIIGGGRLSWWQTETRNPVTDAITATSNVNNEFTPYGGLIFDLTPDVSVYGAYSQIFQPQSNTTSTGSVLAPRTGNQKEIGVKTELLDKHMNAHVALFRIDDENRAMTDPNDNNFSIAAGRVRSQGLEAEISGKPARGWDIVAGYALNKTKYITAAASQQDTEFAPFPPLHNVKLWAKYTFEGGALNGLGLGGGMQFNSYFYSQSGNVRFEQDAYATFSAQVSYSLNERLQASFTVSNLFDEVYYEKLSSASRQNFYGEPRSFMLALRANW